MIEGRVCQSMGQTLGTHIEGNISYIAHNSASIPGCSGGVFTILDYTKTKEKNQNLRFFDGVHKGALNIKKTLSRKERRHIENQNIADGCCMIM